MPEVEPAPKEVLAKDTEIQAALREGANVLRAYRKSRQRVERNGNGERRQEALRSNLTPREAFVDEFMRVKRRYRARRRELSNEHS